MRNLVSVVAVVLAVVVLAWLAADRSPVERSVRGRWTAGNSDAPQVEALAAGDESRRPAAPSALPAAAGAEGLEAVFWQSIANSTNPVEFEAYLERFPNGVFRALAEARLAALRSAVGSPSATAGSRTGGRGAPASGSRASGTPVPASARAAAVAAHPPRDKAYHLSATIHRAPRGCGDTHSFRDRLYTRVSVVDPELERRIEAVARRTQGLFDSISMQHVEWKLEEYMERELRSRTEPLSEADRRSLARLREAKRVMESDPMARLRERERAIEQGRDPPPVLWAFTPEKEVLDGLEARLPLSGTEAERLRQGPELLDAWNRLRSERRNETDPRAMRVYENERLDIALLEEDFFADDRCLDATVTLHRALLDRGSVDLGGGVLTLEFTAVP